jgi:hypothetical protein
LQLDPLVEGTGGLDAAERFLDAIGTGTALRNVIRPAA